MDDFTQIVSASDSLIINLLWHVIHP